MFPDSGFAHAEPSFNTPVPLTGVDIDADPVVYLKVNRVWIPYLAGAMKQLVLQSTWATTDPDALWLQQQRVMMIFANFAYALDHPLQVCTDAVGNQIVLEDDVSQQIRISPDDACIIQMWCIDHWEDWYNPKECIATGAGQPIAGPGGQPGPGVTRSYCFDIPANAPALYPVSVSTGDIVSVSDVSGAWSDGLSGFASLWNCPDGQYYTLGACSGGPITESGDLMPTQPHMGLIAWIDTETFYIGTGATFTVPAGITNAQLLFMPNNSDPSGASGSVSACIEIKTLAAPPLTTIFNHGTGPSQIVRGGTYIFTSDSGSDPTLEVIFSEAVKITILASTLDHPICGTTCTYMVFYNPPGTVTSTFDYPPYHPIDVPPQVNKTEWNMQAGTSGPTFTVTAKIE